MALNIPESLLNLESNCGVFALWMIFQQHGIEKNIEELIQASKHDRVDGTFTIALAFALKKFGFNVSFYTDPDPNIDPDEIIFYENAQVQGVHIHAALSYQQIQQAVESGKLVIVYYDTLDGIGNQSLVYSIDEHEICFFDSFEAMPAQVFEQQRNVDGICQQVIVIDDQNFNLHSSTLH
ncbi:cysteine peptidase family C39 domain-containing protein [Acinetobacter silvestris]|uniref:Peptidase C39 n=1 Tax=Acinetobacter silvestris TaxID=1977882 RepID=A0A1Y3CLN7_9GAMM|nr:cysteine peptidase family C39 domain-containing protein [Acinetobacter silvestris]OTG66799.1 peptidase C39 [Acinetobacter silvestris]